MLIRGSAESKEEITVQKKNNQMGRSNLVCRNPGFRLTRVPASQLTPTIASEISAAAIECGAKAEYRTIPAVAVRRVNVDHLPGSTARFDPLAVCLVWESITFKKECVDSNIFSVLA